MNHQKFQHMLILKLWIGKTLKDKLVKSWIKNYKYSLQSVLSRATWFLIKIKTRCWYVSILPISILQYSTSVHVYNTFLRVMYSMLWSHEHRNQSFKQCTDRVGLSSNSITKRTRNTFDNTKVFFSFFFSQIGQTC